MLRVNICHCYLYIYIFMLLQCLWKYNLYMSKVTVAQILLFLSIKTLVLNNLVWLEIKWIIAQSAQ